MKKLKMTSIVVSITVSIILFVMLPMTPLFRKLEEWKNKRKKGPTSR